MPDSTGPGKISKEDEKVKTLVPLKRLLEKAEEQGIDPGSLVANPQDVSVVEDEPAEDDSDEKG